MNKLNVSAVSYLNTRPFLYGLERSDIRNKINLSLDVPSVIAKKLLSGDAQIGLVPVAVIPKIRNAKIISNYCIGANGKVETVCLYSNVPIEKIEAILLDHQSETSVKLIQVLMKFFWNKQVNYINALPGFEREIKDTVAAVVIGDRNFEMRNQFNSCIDLAEEWKNFTGMKFMFAAWVSTIDLNDELLLQFNEALKDGVTHIAEVSNEASMNYPGIDVQHYLSNCISFERDEMMMAGYQKFIELLQQL